MTPTPREELIDKLRILKIHQLMSSRDNLGNYASLEQLGDIADYILEDRNRIVEPLVKELKLLKSCFEDRREIVLHVNDIDWKSIDGILNDASTN